jgi:hypothetical protein
LSLALYVVRFQIRIVTLLHLHELFKAASWIIVAGPGMECREKRSEGRKTDYAFFCFVSVAVYPCHLVFLETEKDAGEVLH